YPMPAGDETRYTTAATNMLAGRGFSNDTSPPYGPTEHVVPLYPLFIAMVYVVFGENNSAVRIAQGALDLLTCLLVAFIAFNLAPASLRGRAAIVSLTIYGCLSWFTVHWSRYILAETLALFLTTLAIAVAILAVRGSRWLWLAVGAICGLALLTRADSVLLVSAFLLFLTFRVLQRGPYAFVSLLLFCLAVPAVLAPWVIRNYAALGKFQPLASEYGFARGGFMPTGYLWWIRTWMTDETYAIAFRPAFVPSDRSFNPHELPDSIFDSPGERAQVLQLLEECQQRGQFTPEMSDRFRTIGNERIKRAPFRFLIWLPIKRVASVWLTGFSTHNRPHLLLRILFVLPILIGGVLGFAFFSRNQPLAQLLLLVILTRTIFLAYHYSPEARYIVEAYPAMIAACGVSGAAFWLYCRQNWLAKWRRVKIEG
ncbi:MAG TPA: glycosyltransferase family 39 protein, partial [Pyrinomonadaceae bacterium]|nr:glycosyltransferase family 39 protein [Pyrinomonadaceae bacterium]